MAAPPATRASARTARTVTLSVFIDVSSLEGLDQSGDDSRKGRLSFASLVVGRLPALAVRDHDQLEVRHALDRAWVRAAVSKLSQTMVTV